MTDQVLIIATDWWVVSSTIIAGILTALATIGAVIYTNKKTTEQCNKEQEYRNKKEKMVVVKPVLKFCTFMNLIEELIIYNSRDRILLISSEKEGFDFYDDKIRRNTENHRILCIKNESQNSITCVNIDMHSKLKTDSSAVIENSYSNFIKLLRAKEEIVLKPHNTEQRTRLWEELNKNKMVEFWFNCTVNYLTEAEVQVEYQFEARIINTPELTKINGRSEIINNFKIIITKDEYKILNTKTLDDNKEASIFRNIQDYILIDRAEYIHRKIGVAQAQGIMSQFGAPTTCTTETSSTKVEDTVANET